MIFVHRQKALMQEAIVFGKSDTIKLRSKAALWLMKYYLNLTGCILIVVCAIASVFGPVQSTFALGCDTQERISGNIGNNCGHISTEDLFNIRIEKRKTCIDAQLTVAIADYNNNWGVYYTQWLEQQDIPNIALQPSEDSIQLLLTEVNKRPVVNSISVDSFCQF